MTHKMYLLLLSLVILSLGDDSGPTNNNFGPVGNNFGAIYKSSGIDSIIYDTNNNNNNNNNEGSTNKNFNININQKSTETQYILKMVHDIYANKDIDLLAPPMKETLDRLLELLYVMNNNNNKEK